MCELSLIFLLSLFNFVYKYKNTKSIPDEKSRLFVAYGHQQEMAEEDKTRTRCCGKALQKKHRAIDPTDI